MEIVKNTKNIKIIKNIFVVLIGTIFLAISSKIKIPFYPVPMTMQTFVVLFIAVSLGWRLATATVALYLFQGMIGLPVFAGSPEKGVGLVYFMGPTMGYLIGFLVTAFFAGLFDFNKNFLINFIKLIFSVSFIYIFGILWLGMLIGWDKQLFQIGAQPFLLAELFKILLITFLISKIKNIRKLI